MRETISDIIAEAGAMFATLDPEIAQAIIAMSVTIAFIALPVVIFVFIFFHSFMRAVKNQIIYRNNKYVQEIKDAYADSVVYLEPEDDDTDTMPLYIVHEQNVNKDEWIATETIAETFKRLQNMSQK